MERGDLYESDSNIMRTDSAIETGGAMEVVAARRTRPQLGLTEQETKER